MSVLSKAKEALIAAAAKANIGPAQLKTTGPSAGKKIGAVYGNEGAIRRSSLANAADFANNPIIKYYGGITEL